MKLGAWPEHNGVAFRVWAPQVQTVAVVPAPGFSRVYPMQAEKGGYYFTVVPGLAAGALYKYRIDGNRDFPDPCSRFQPEGVHGPSMVVAPQNYKWADQSWQRRGVGLQGQVMYELHVGTFTPEGTYAGVMTKLAALKELGVTVIELMPLADFPGRWNWGYDGVALFAPPHVYGTPDELRALVDQAHQMGIGVILDVVYNHLGPDGNYLANFSRDYFTDRYETDWGEAINFDGPNAREVRNFFIQNALHWLTEYHADGLRLDATQNIYDHSGRHILAEIAAEMRRKASPKNILLIGENESQHVWLMTPIDQGGGGLDALWNDDFHHAAHVALTGRREAYYRDYLGRPQEFIAAFKYGYLYQGQYYTWQEQLRGTPVPDTINAAKFIAYLQNHDQVANSLDGTRLQDKGDAALCRVLTALLLLSPQTPMLFMGQEFGASSPFLFFADHHAELSPLVTAGRRKFLSQFPSVHAALHRVQDPNDEATFQRCILKWEEREAHKHIYDLHADLLRLRREDPIIFRQDRGRVDGAVLTGGAFVLRYKGQGSDRLLVVNLGQDVDFSPCPEPLLAPLTGSLWDLQWSSDDPKYGGKGTVSAISSLRWNIPGHTAQIFSSGGKVP